MKVLVWPALFCRLQDMTQIIQIRPFAGSDAAAVAAVYSHHVLTGTATFEEVTPDKAEMAARLSSLQDAGFPVLVACLAGELVGYAYAGPYKTRSAYRFTVEDSIYIHQDHHRKGIGKALLSALISACSDKGYKQLLAVIGDSDNHGSIGLHRSCGFTSVGVARKLGFKFGRWLDVVYMQLSLHTEQNKDQERHIL